VRLPSLRLFLISLSVVGLSACAKVPNGNFVPQTTNQTGFKAADGKTFTGASPGTDLDQMKAELTSDTGRVESLAQPDRDLAANIQSARIDATAASLRVYVWIRDTGRLSFEFKKQSLSENQPADQPTDLRFKAVVGIGPSGGPTAFELALLCRRPPEAGDSKDLSQGCRTATFAMKSSDGAGAKAGFIIHNQPTLVIAKAPNADLKHATLKRLMSDLKTAKAGTLQSFEVAWGPSGFALNIGDSQVCPAGRLVETNDLDEPLKMNCPDQPEFTDLDGRLIGNTTRGELFLELTAATRGMIYGENTEHIYLLIRQKRDPKKSTPPAQPVKNPGTPAAPVSPTVPGAKSPVTTAPPSAQNPPAAPNDSKNVDESDDEDDAVFPDDPKTDPAPVVVSSGSGWLFPVEANGPYTKIWAHDRKKSVIQRAIKEWTVSGRLAAFIRHFQPNRDLVLSGLAKSGVPGEFALMTAYESHFFIHDGYPVEASGPGAAGPWQFMPGTASMKSIGLKVFPLVRVGKQWTTQPCDERADLEKSSVAAGRLLRSLLDTFPSKPYLALMAYNMGEGGVKKRISNLKATRSPDRIQRIKELGVGYWTIREFGMAPTETLEYIPKFLGAYHAILEMKPQPIDPTVKPWTSNAKCK
jgi:hypothetical protein